MLDAIFTYQFRTFKFDKAKTNIHCINYVNVMRGTSLTLVF